MSAAPEKAEGVSPFPRLEGELSVADYHRLARAIDAGSAAVLQPLRLSLLSTCTLEFVRPFLVVEGARRGLHVQAQFGPFGQVEQQVADPSSALYAARPELLVIAMRPEDIAPEALLRPYARRSSGLRSVLTSVVERILGAVEHFRARSAMPVLVANFADPGTQLHGPLDSNLRDSVTYAIAEANAALQERLGPIANVAIWDFAGLARRRGTEQWTDRRLWALARVPVAQRHQPALAADLVRVVSAVLRPPAKCLVLDLDNTLWGGVIGDDGLAGIQLGDDYPGNVFKDFQRRVLSLMDRGILLAVVSKNDEDVAREAFERHPEMAVKWNDLAGVRINWEPKSTNLRRLAKELNIGADQLVFFDDNPIERAEVRLNAPEVLVVDVPPDAVNFAAALDAVPWFDQLSLSEEDRRRTDLYHERRMAAAEEERFDTVDEFLASLQMVAEVGEVSDTTMARVAQLIGKTNQFNLTTRRHTASDLAAMTMDPQAAVAWLRLNDRFGDQGLVAVGILRRDGEHAIVDSMLMSCRVMNRRVEQAFMAYLVEQARRLGCREVRGEYRPSSKNGMVRDFYVGLGFSALDAEGRWFGLDLSLATVDWPAVIERRDAPTRST